MGAQFFAGQMKPKICIFFCGGTMVMVPNAQGVLVPPSKENALHSVLSLEPRLHGLADIDLEFIANIDSSDMTPDIWDRLVTSIAKSYSHYDGFVVLHGTDTMAYTASAVSFALRNLGKPVVFTGAQIPGHQLESDARRNLVNAVRLACMDVAGVMLVMGEKILLGVRSSKISHSKLNAFASFNWPKLGEVGRQIQILREVQHKQGQDLRLEEGFVSEIAVLSLAPGMPASVLDHLLSQGVKGIVINAYGTGNIPQIYLPSLERARDKNIPIVIRTQCPEGSTQMSVYATGKQALECGAIEAFDMSLESTITKLMWALKRAKTIEEIKTIMHHNYAGEINSDGERAY